MRFASLGLSILATAAMHAADIPPLPEQAKLALVEDWSSGKVDPTRWYALRKQWGAGNHGVVPENVSVVKDGVQFVLQCEAHGDDYDFPEYGKAGRFTTPMFNTFLNKQHDSLTYDVHGAADGRWHAYTTEWRTELVPIEGVTDAQVGEAEGFHWVQDKAVPYARHWGNPLKQLGPNRYAVCSGKITQHWVDGKFIGENTKFVPSMTGQLNLGMWLPEWAGSAAWKTAVIRFGTIKVWQYDDPGDVKGVLTEDITNNFDAAGKAVK